MDINGKYTNYDPYSEPVKREHDFRPLLTWEDIREANLWETFATLVYRMRHPRPGDDSNTVAYAIEGLMRVGKAEAAQVLAVEALAVTHPDVHEAIHLALKKEWFRSQSSARLSPVLAERRRLQLLYWTDRERKCPTWPPSDIDSKKG